MNKKINHYLIKNNKILLKIYNLIYNLIFEIKLKIMILLVRNFLIYRMLLSKIVRLKVVLEILGKGKYH